jgi:tRNA A37 threonylcarbamoyladenosine synthetase subunit TsaC/SUA5/YrdC
VPKTLTDAKRRTVGIRITSSPIAQALCEALGRPLLTTSAIAPGTTDACRDADEVLDVFGHALDVVIDSAMTGGEPSTVIEVDGDNVSVLREGAGPIDGLFD